MLWDVHICNYFDFSFFTIKVSFLNFAYVHLFCIIPLENIKLWTAEEVKGREGEGLGNPKLKG